MEGHKSALSHSTLMQAVIPHRPGTHGNSDTSTPLMMHPLEGLMGCALTNVAMSM